MTHVMQLIINALFMQLQIRSRNEHMSITFNNDELKKIRITQSFNNILRKICYL